MNLTILFLGFITYIYRRKHNAIKKNKHTVFYGKTRDGMSKTGFENLTKYKEG